jgi:hypothetical protein
MKPRFAVSSHQPIPTLVPFGILAGYPHYPGLLTGVIRDTMKMSQNQREEALWAYAHKHASVSESGATHEDLGYILDVDTMLGSLT